MSAISRTSSFLLAGIALTVCVAANLREPRERCETSETSGARESRETRTASGLSYTEKIVAGGPDDFAIVRHVRLQGTQHEIGKKLGEIAKERHHVELPETDPTLLRARREYFRVHYPMHFERGAGVAEAFGIPFAETNRDPFRLWFDMEPPGCSTVFYPGAFTASGHATLSRDYDFTTGTFAEMLGEKPSKNARPMDADTYVMEVYPDKGYPSLFLCAYDLLSGALDGINSAGLTLAMLADGDAQSGADQLMSVQAGLNQLELPRFLLETCATTEEAKTALMAAKQYYLFIPAHFIIGDRSGHSFVWEYGPAHNREYITDGAGKPQVVTNHELFRDSEASLRSTGPGSSRGRSRAMESAIAKIDGKCTTDDIKRINGLVRATGNGTGVPPERTLWHVVYDCESLTLDVDFYLGEPSSPNGSERRSGYVHFKLAR